MEFFIRLLVKVRTRRSCDLGSTDFLSFGSSPVGYEKFGCQNSTTLPLPFSGTPHEPKSISSNCQQPRHTAGALCGFPNCNTKFSSRDSFDHECFQHQTYRRQHLWLKFFDLGLGMNIYSNSCYCYDDFCDLAWSSIRLYAANWSDTGSSCISPGRECSISMSTPGVTLQPWSVDVTMMSQTPRGFQVWKSCCNMPCTLAICYVQNFFIGDFLVICECLFTYSQSTSLW